MAYVLMWFAGLLLVGLGVLTVAWVRAKLESYRKEIKDLKSQAKEAEADKKRAEGLVKAVRDEISNAPVGDVTASLIEGRMRTYHKERVSR